MIYNKNHKSKWKAYIVAGIAAVFGITFLLQIITNWDLFTIPIILSFIMVCLCIWFDVFDFFDLDIVLPISVFVSIGSFIVAGILYIGNFDKCEYPDESTTRTNIISVKDNSYISGNMSGGIISVKGSVAEQSVYVYYYQLDDGGVYQGTIPANSTVLYFDVETEEEAYLETVVTTEYYWNNNDSPATRCWETSNTKYKIHIPAIALPKGYEFDGE